MMPLYVIPGGLLLFSLLPRKYRPAAGGFLSLGILYLLGGWKLPAAALSTTCLAWLYQRLMPAGKRGAQIPAGILLTAMLIAARHFFTPVQCLPLLLLAARHMLCAHDRAENNLPVVGLFPYCGYALSPSTLLAGPVVHFPAYQAKKQPGDIPGAERREHLGSGASRCIRGLFLLSAFAVPMQRLSGELLPRVNSIPDYFLLAACLFLGVYFGLKGLYMVCRGIAGMQGILWPRGFETPVAAGSLHGFVERFWTGFTSVITGHTPQGTFAYFFYAAWLLMTCGTVLARNMLCGLFWGMIAALMLTAEHSVPVKELQVIPLAVRRILTVILVLLPLPFLGCASLPELGGCLAAWGGGVRLTGTVRYLAGNHLLLFPACILGLFPVRRMLYCVCTSPKSRSILLVARPVTEVLMLLFSAAALYSTFTRG